VEIQRRRPDPAPDGDADAEATLKVRDIDIFDHAAKDRQVIEVCDHTEHLQAVGEVPAGDANAPGT